MRRSRFLRPVNLAMGAVTLGALAFIGWIVSWTPGWQDDHPMVGSPAGDVDGWRWLDGQTVAPEPWRGRVVLLVFWSKRALPCHEQLADAQRLADRYKADPRVRVIGFNVDVGPARVADVDAVRAFTAEHGLTFAQVIEPSGRAFRTWSVEALPRNVLVDAAGVVRGVYVGRSPQSVDQIARCIDILLADG